MIKKEKFQFSYNIQYLYENLEKQIKLYDKSKNHANKIWAIRYYKKLLIYHREKDINRLIKLPNYIINKEIIKIKKVLKSNGINKNYDNESKNQIRNDITNIMKNKLPFDAKIAMLETSKFLAINELKEYNFNIHLYQHSIEEYNIMSNNLPKNTKIIFGDINKKIIESKCKYDCIWLDYCTTINKNEDYVLNIINNSLNINSYLFMTFSLRAKEDEKMEFYIQKFINFLSININYNLYLIKETSFIYKGKGHSERMLSLSFKINNKKYYKHKIPLINLIDIKQGKYFLENSKFIPKQITLKGIKSFIQTR